MQADTTQGEFAALRAELELLRARNLQLETMLAAVPVGIVVTDDKGQILAGNPAVERMVRHPVFYSADADSYGEWVSYHRDGRRVESREYPLARIVLDGEERAELDVHYQRGDGTRFWMRIIGEPIRNAAGERVGATVALVDIDETVKLTDQKELLIGELDHRVKNAFTVMKAIVRRSLDQTSLPPDEMTTILERLEAYSRSHAALNERGISQRDLRNIADDIVGAYPRVEVEGGSVMVGSRPGLSIAMALYELLTNAIKHGSLSVPEGRVALEWGVADDVLTLSWRERGGPAVVPPTREGFGTFVLDRALRHQTNGGVEVDYAPDGLRWSLTMPLDRA